MFVEECGMEQLETIPKTVILGKKNIRFAELMHFFENLQTWFFDNCCLFFKHANFWNSRKSKKKKPPNSKVQKKSREFSYTFFIGSESMIFWIYATLCLHKGAHLIFVETQTCTHHRCGNTKNIYFPNAKLWKHKLAKCNFVFTQSWVILTCVGL